MAADRITFNPNHEAISIDRSGNKRTHFRPFRTTATDWARRIHSTAPSVGILMTESANQRIMVFAGNEAMTDQCRNTLLNEIRDYTNRLRSASYYADPKYPDGFARESKDKSVCVIQPPAQANLDQQKIDNIIAGIDSWSRTAPAGTGAGTGAAPAPAGTGAGGTGTRTAPAPAGNGNGGVHLPARPAGVNDAQWGGMASVYALYGQLTGTNG